MRDSDVQRGAWSGAASDGVDGTGGGLGDRRAQLLDDTTVSALARHLGVDWHTGWDAIEVEAKARIGDPSRLKNVKTLGVDEHIWRPSRIGFDRAVTIMVDLTP